MSNSHQDIIEKVIEMINEGYKPHEAIIYVRDNFKDRIRNPVAFSYIFCIGLYIPLNIITRIMGWNKLFGSLEYTDKEVDDIMSPYIDIERIKKEGIRKTIS